MSNNYKRVEVVPETTEYFCKDCIGELFIEDIIKEGFKIVTVTIERLEVKEDENEHFRYTILCTGVKDRGDHPAIFKVTRHKIEETIPVIPTSNSAPINYDVLTTVASPMINQITVFPTQKE